MTEEKQSAKYQLELINKEFSHDKGGYLAITGKTRTGKQMRVVMFDAVAHALENKLNSVISPGETVSSMSLMVDFVGRWMEKANAAEGRSSRYFKVHEFDLLEGRSLELARIGREAARALEVSQKVVDVESAYHVLAEFVAKIGRVTFDPMASAYHAALKSEFDGSTLEDAPAADPEEEAARRYDEQDRVSGLTGAILEAGEISPNDENAISAADVPDASLEDDVSVSNGNEDELVLTGSLDGAENAQELEAMSLVEEDVQDGVTLDTGETLILEETTVAETDPEPDFSEPSEDETSTNEGEQSLDDEAEQEVAEELVEKPAPAPAPAAPSRQMAPARPSAPARIPPRPSAPSAPRR